MKNIVIIGAGISGLYIANLLSQNSNYKITIYFDKEFLLKVRKALIMF